MWLFPNDLLNYQTQSLIIFILRKKKSKKIVVVWTVEAEIFLVLYP